MPEASEGRRGLVMGRWKKPTHSQVVGAVAAIPGLLFLTTRKFLPTAVAFVLGHTSLAGFVVAIASTKRFANSSTGLLGKDSKGNLSLWSLGLFFPFHAALRAKLWLRSKRSEEPLYSHVLDDWYIGGWPRNLECLPGCNPAVLDCTCELPRRHNRPYLCIASWDTHCASIQGLEEGVRWSLEQKKKGNPVLVHCAHGHGRSAAMLCAILIEEGKARSVKDAEALIKKQRPRVRLNRNQNDGLSSWFKWRQKAKN